jgi:cytochrome c2
MNGSHATTLAVLASFAIASQCYAAEGNPTRGQRAFGACAACHSLQADQNMTGPSLAGVWDRKAGTVVSFTRYSPALKSANIVWNDKTLDEWITDPQRVVPGNQMTFPGIKDAKQRADLLAFLKEATQRGGSQVAQQGEEGDKITSLHVTPLSSARGSLTAETSTLIGAETGIKTIAAVHSPCRCWVKSGQTVPSQNLPLSAIVRKRPNNGPGGAALHADSQRVMESF